MDRTSGIRQENEDIAPTGAECVDEVERTAALPADTVVDLGVFGVMVAEQDTPLAAEAASEPVAETPPNTTWAYPLSLVVNGRAIPQSMRGVGVVHRTDWAHNNPRLAGKYGPRV